MSSKPADGQGYALVAHVRTHEESAYLKYVQEVYFPALAQMEGFVALRLLRWSPSSDPVNKMIGQVTEFLRISTWRSKDDAQAYFDHPVRATFSELRDLAMVLAYGGAEVLLDLTRTNGVD